MASPTKANGTSRDIGRPEAKQAKASKANPVGRVIGLNAATPGSTIPQGSSTIGEMIGVTGKSTVHNNYFTEQGLRNALIGKNKKERQVILNKFNRYWGKEVPKLTPVVNSNLREPQQ